MKKSFKLISISLFFILLFTSGFGCGSPSTSKQSNLEQITLDYWRVFDGTDAFSEIIQNYNKTHPNITINYRKFRYEEYEYELLNAFAEDRGPDIFSIHNTWIKKYQSKLSPMPESISMVYPVEKGGLKKEIVPQTKTKPSITIKQLRDNFAETVYHDVVFEDQIYGLPLSVDTLALYYNRDLLNNAGITDIPQYWNKKFQEHVKKLTIQDSKRGIVQSGVALGGSKNIDRYTDILSLLMMQNGSVMMNERGQVMFHAVPPHSQEQNYNPGMEALRFYTDFSNPAKEVYSWNTNLDNSIDMFTSGNLAFMFNYAYRLPEIKAKAPKLNFSVSKMLQIEGSPRNINFANYWIETVSQKSEHKQEAWDFIQFMTTNPDQAKLYLEKTQKPTALKSLISKQKKENSELGIFSEQTLTAKSWYRGRNPQAMENIMAELINRVVNNELAIKDAITQAANKVQQTIN